MRDDVMTNGDGEELDESCEAMDYLNNWAWQDVEVLFSSVDISFLILCCLCDRDIEWGVAGSTSGSTLQ